MNRNNVDAKKIQMDTQLCTLNGIYAASSACIGLAQLFDTLISTEEGEEADSGETNTNTDTDAAKEPIDEENASMIYLVKWNHTPNPTKTSYTNLFTRLSSNGVAKSAIQGSHHLSLHRCLNHHVYIAFISIYLTKNTTSIRQNSTKLKQMNGLISY